MIVEAVFLCAPAIAIRSRSDVLGMDTALFLQIVECGLKAGKATMIYSAFPSLGLLSGDLDIAGPGTPSW
jgi:hypothetical protein